MSVKSVLDLDREMTDVKSLISCTRPGSRHEHLPRLHNLVSQYARRNGAIPGPLRQLQEELTDEAIEARFDNMPI